MLIQLPSVRKCVLKWDISALDHCCLEAMTHKNYSLWALTWQFLEKWDLKTPFLSHFRLKKNPKQMYFCLEWVNSMDRVSWIYRISEFTELSIRLIFNINSLEIKFCKIDQRGKKKKNTYITFEVPGEIRPWLYRTLGSIWWRRRSSSPEHSLLGLYTRLHSEHFIMGSSAAWLLKYLFG